ncbi:PadR family transcriptional regulator [Wukongibacter baidiensis]|uniref:PadR family transcriptional regulator n=1 Tax=Wukongibacter baidiensis TaxID=1723361 RepID=UPI003D7FF114
MKKLKQIHHAPAFVLLFLAEGPSYGLDLQKKMTELIPDSKIDCAAIYRSLKSLESDELVRPEWDTSDSGPAKKYYYITEKGLNKLSEFKKDIEAKIANLNLFLNRFQELNSEEINPHK